MVKSSEREETTKFASNKITTLLTNEDYTSAILLASIYVSMRLRTLITLRLSPPEEYWQDTSKSFDSLLGYSTLTKLCSKLGLVGDFDIRVLRDIWKKRCKVAHETELWRTVPEAERKEIKRLCNSAIDFLRQTTN